MSTAAATTDIDFDFFASAAPAAHHTAKFETASGETVQVRLVVDGAGPHFDGASVEFQPVVGTLPAGWSIDDAKSALMADLRSSSPLSWGVPRGLAAALRSGAASFENCPTVGRWRLGVGMVSRSANGRFA